MRRYLNLPYINREEITKPKDMKNGEFYTDEPIRIKYTDKDLPTRNHAIDYFGDDPRTLCSGHVWWDGEHQDVEGWENGKTVTCPECLKIIKYWKKYKQI